jgi:hypothetical protein
MNQPLQHIREWRDVDADKFRREIVTLYQPAVLKGLVAAWPAVRHGIESPRAISAYLNGFDSGAEVDIVMAPARVKGRLFYDESMEGFNFTRDRQTLSAVNEQLLRFAKFDNRPSVVAQSALISDCIPGFAGENKLAILHESIAPRIWLGNAVVTPAHFDESNNIACVVAGRRRFTLLPPEQIANLYVGPLGHAPTGTPISLVSFREPDFERFPRFREALAAAVVAELDPGDALYIPTLWWHHIESLAKYNVLINYWWKGASDAPSKAESALDPLLHSLLNLNHVAPEHRQAWAAIFNHYVFHAQGDPAAQIPERARGMLGPISPELAQQLRAFLIGKLKR